MSRRVALASACSLVLLLVTSACGKGSSHPKLKIDPAITQCESDSDCTLVVMECCDQCNGGWEWSVAVRMASEAKARYGKPCPEDTRCTAMACSPEPEAVCAMGTCATRTAQGTEYNEVRE